MSAGVNLNKRNLGAKYLGMAYQCKHRGINIICIVSNKQSDSNILGSSSVVMSAQNVSKAKRSVCHGGIVYSASIVNM